AGSRIDEAVDPGQTGDFFVAMVLEGELVLVTLACCLPHGVGLDGSIPTQSLALLLKARDHSSILIKRIFAILRGQQSIDLRKSHLLILRGRRPVSAWQLAPAEFDRFDFDLSGNSRLRLRCNE